MFIGFTKRLKSMSGFRLGFGIRVNKHNWWYWLLMMIIVGCFYLMWYMIIGCGWLLYGLFYGLYKIYYYLFKYAAIGCKKLYALVKGKVENNTVEK